MSEQLGLFVNLDSLREDEPAYAAEWEMNVSLRPLEHRDLDTIYQQVTDPESVRMAAFTAEFGR